MEQRLKRRKNKLCGKREIENKVASKEITPKKAVIPQAHSTPVEPEVISISDSQSESEDEDEDTPFCFTQDTLEVQWDYSNTPKRKEKKKTSKNKRKSKGSTFTKNKRRQEFSPIEALKIRRRCVKEEPKADLTKLIAGLQALAEKVKEEQALHKDVVQKDLPNDSYSTSSKAHLDDDDDQILRGSKNARKQLLAPSTSNPGLKEEFITETVNENFTSLFDDDADDCIVRCSQEVEQKLHESDTVDSTKNEKPSSDSVRELSSKKPDVDENRPQNYPNETEIGKESLKTSEDDFSINVQLEKEDCNLSDIQILKKSCILLTVSNSDPVHNAQGGINESFTALFEDDADDCMVLCSQEIEEKFNNKHIDSNATMQSSHNNDLKNANNSDGSADKKIQTSYIKAKSDSVLLVPSTSTLALDDSLDMLLQNFTEEDINKLSQGVPVKKNCNSLTSNSNKCRFPNSENNLKRNSVTKKSVNRCIPMTNKSVYQVTKYKHSQSFYSGGVTNKLGASTSNKISCEVPNVISASVNGVILNGISPVLISSTVSGIVEEKLNSNSKMPYRSLHPDTSNCLKAEMPYSFSKTSPQKCTPEEIEKKRLEARKKLEMKKCSLKQEKDRYSHPFR